MQPAWSVAVAGSRLRLGATLVGALVLAAAGMVSAIVAGGESVLDRDERLASVLVAAMVVGSVLVHEGAHALAARKLGYRVEWVVLGLVDGRTSYSGRTDRPIDRAAIAMAGPAVSAAVALALLGVWAAGVAGPHDAVLVGAWFNVVTFGLNLVPIAGSDGAFVIAGLIEDGRRRSARQR